MSPERQLVTYALFAYNQEHFIREAVRGALAQTYSPLEIILSDDCSTDRTWDAMREETERYKGPHKILLNRNKENLGIGAHVNRVMKLCKTRLLVVGAGDDVSIPCRVEELMNTWSANGFHSGSLCSRYLRLAEDGMELGDGGYNPVATIDRLLVNIDKGIHGSTHAWTRDVFEIFGDLDSRVVYEDRIIPLRSAMIGRISFVDKPLVKYRVQRVSVSNCECMGYKDLMRWSATVCERREVVYDNFLRDLETARQLRLAPVKRLDELKDIVNVQRAQLRVKKRFLRGDAVTRLKSLGPLWPHVSALQWAKWGLFAIVPRMIGFRTRVMGGMKRQRRIARDT